MKQNVYSTIVLLVVIFSIGLDSNAQNVAINEDGSAPDNSAILDLKSTSRGLLTPRMTSSERTSITTPASGLVVYDTDSSAFIYYTGSTWLMLDTVTYETPVYGSAYEDNIDATYSDYVVGTSYIGDTTFTAGELSGITFNNDNTNGDYLEIPTGSGGVYWIQLNISFQGDNGPENIVGIFKNSDASPIPGMAFERTTSSNASGSGSTGGLVALAAGDQIRVKFKTDGTNNSFTIVSQNLMVRKIN